MPGKLIMAALLSMCKPLADNMTLINYIRENQCKGLTVEQAVDEAVKQCIEENVLSDFLTKHRAEVMDVCLTEYNEKVFINGIHEEGEDMMGKLVGLLLSDGHVEDAQRVATDKEARNKEARKQFYREYGIID